MQGEVVDARPGGRGAGFAMDVDVAAVGGGGEDGAVFGVGPGKGPDCAFVPGGEELVRGFEGECGWGKKRWARKLWMAGLTLLMSLLACVSRLRSRIS